MVEDFAVIGGLIGVQFVNAGNSVFLSYLMSIGINPLTLIVFSSFATFLVLCPFSIYFERSNWPEKISFKLIIQLVVIGFLGVTLFQSLFMKGIDLTSPAIATAMPNLAPGLVFVIAWIFRLEKVKLSCLYSKVKISGTILCIIGAVMMSIMHSSMAEENQSSSSLANDMFDKQKIIGCSYLMAAVLALSSNIVLQAATLGDFPAPISLCAITSLIGAITTACVKLLEDFKLQTSWDVVSLRTLIGISLLGGSVMGACLSFNGWAMKKRGPVLVSMFSPIATVLSIIISMISLGDTISFGSIAGMCLIFSGLYFVLWAKGKEGFIVEDTLKEELDVEKPLLS